ncbi:hypothetical protein LPC08_17135 [Roseomonas sp. OT10]|uniref:hypothetical protein n=1 Tax=Roseomonas cutis TaxID=2897332 RepID=UPI001E55085E|nr:hypothetical protein [Roseomonas sp. OT10]UFN47728.1 hypothetical protein LPC08_17135 [Roseomonas sp. OT10]
MRRCALAALLLLALHGAARAQEASWTGRLRCDPIPGMTAGSLNAAITVTVVEGLARYEREVQTPTGQNRGLPETGQGRVAADGAVVLEGRVQGPSWSYTARYAGRLAGRVAVLEGAQSWAMAGRSVERPCSARLERR